MTDTLARWTLPWALLAALGCGDAPEPLWIAVMMPLAADAPEAGLPTLEWALDAVNAAGDVLVREAALQGFLADRERRRSLPVLLDSLGRMNLTADTARTRSMVEVLGYVGWKDRNVNRTLARVAQRAPALLPAVTLARRRLSIGF